MNPIMPSDRRVANIRDADAFVTYDHVTETGTAMLLLDRDMPRDVGF
ncbi:hypothetical protein FIU86_08460 [Roseovarius sp. THAF9]|nr:hypothetical protein [Roseovarius sp. THAF9]QFT92874.1 hypothetical protein FIU86_08460 [Roseovarius sp. THAF9]